jgi:hypothetical protein
MLAQYAVICALATSALGTVFITAPVATTSWQAGQKQTVTWQDDGKAPDLKTFGPAVISIYAGNAKEQTGLQVISPSTDVSTASSIDFTPDPKIGPESDNYFIRFESINAKDSAAPQFPALAFSAKFKLTGMSGTFNSTVQAQIDGQSTAPIGGSAPATPSSTAAAGATTKPAASTAKPSGASSGTPAKTSTAASGKPSNGASMTMSLSGLVAIAAAMAAAVIAL